MGSVIGLVVGYLLQGITGKFKPNFMLFSVFNA